MPRNELIVIAIVSCVLAIISCGGIYYIRTHSDSGEIKTQNTSNVTAPSQSGSVDGANTDPIVPDQPDPVQSDYVDTTSQSYWYCWDTGDPSPHHLGYEVSGDHYCTDAELQSAGMQP